MTTSGSTMPTSGSTMPTSGSTSPTIGSTTLLVSTTSTADNTTFTITSTSTASETQTSTSTTKLTTVITTSSTPNIPITSTTTNNSTNAETEDNVKSALYISIPAAVVSVLLIVLITCLVLRSYCELCCYRLRRKKRKRRRNIESVAVYYGMDFTKNDRKPVAGIVNASYSSHSLNILENRDFSNTKVPGSNDSLNTKINSSEMQSEHTSESQGLDPQGIMEDRFGYNHVRKPMKEFNDDCYSHVTISQEGFRIENDSSYSHIGNRLNEASLNSTINECDIDFTVGKFLHTTEENIAKNTDISKRYSDQESTYDHAKAGGTDPKDEEENEYSHLNGLKENKEMDIHRHHRYENVVKTNEGGCTEAKRLARNEYCNVNTSTGNEDNVAVGRHEYVNVTKDKEKLDTVNVKGDYEQAIGHTPTYFVVEP